MPSQSIPVVIENLTFRYRSREEPAIRNISLSIDTGKLMLIAGASGCGKTTLIRCINGLIPRSYKGELSGKVYLQGQNISRLSLANVSQLIGTVLQDPERQILGTRVISEVAFGLENLGLPRDEITRKAEDALRYLGIFHLRDRETFNLSGGEKQKVALAGVLAMQPRVLVLDEPLASLDPASAQETLTLVRRLADEGMTVMMIEHRVEDVLNIHPDSILYMDAGEIKYQGDAAGLAKAVNYHEIKLPAQDIIIRAAADTIPIQSEPAVAKKADPLAEPLVKFENVAFGYDAEQEVLHGVSLNINRGDIIAVLGPNGAGKTTLVKHAIGLLKPRVGKVLVNGKDSHDLSVAQIASTMGYVFQSPSHMLFAPSVREELAFGPTNLKHSPETIKAEVARAIQIVNLVGKEEDPPLALSFGQQKRVSIAAILAMQSRILVMDEPTAGQDYKNYVEFMQAIMQLPSFEAILFITHDIDLAVVFANRIFLVNQGQLIRDGKPSEVLSDLELLKANRLVPTSLLHMNLEQYSHTGRFMSAEEMAHTLPDLAGSIQQKEHLTPGSIPGSGE